MQKGFLSAVSNLLAYSVKSIVIRVLLVSIFSFSFLFLAVNTTDQQYLPVSYWEYAQVILALIICSELNIVLDVIAERLFPIPEKLRTRILLHLLLSSIIGVITYSYFNNLYKEEHFIDNPVVKLMIAFGIIFIIMLIVIAIGIRITQKWIISENQIHELKQAKLKSDYNSLQDQLNPHFLFNNLSVLKSMIMYNQKAALEFTQNFTDVYRYVLQSKDKTTVLLTDEMQFINSYLALHKERLGDGLIVNIDIKDLHKEIPPLALQLLVENAIKHNVTSKDKPLNLNIFSDDNYIIVENNLQPKESTYSVEKGLNNLIMRYMLLSDDDVVITRKNSFCVKLPLL